MDTAVAIRTLEATYKSSADAAAVETMILKLTEKVWMRVATCIRLFLGLYTCWQVLVVHIIIDLNGALIVSCS